MLRTIILLFILLGSTKAVHAQSLTTPLQTSGDTSIVLLFESGSYELSPGLKDQVRAFYKKYIINDSVHLYTLAISGFSDSKGTETANYKLSQKRATAVGTYLLSLANDTALHKIFSYDYMDPCKGVQYKREEGIIGIRYLYFGEEQLKTLPAKDLNEEKERKVLLNFKDYRDACLGTFSECYLPSATATYKDDGYTITIPQGSIDEFTSGHALPPCRYDSLTDLKIVINDSIADPAQACSLLQSSFSAKAKNNGLYFGSLNFKILLNDKSFDPPPCKSNTHREKRSTIRIPLSKIPFKKFTISDGKNPVDYKLLKDSIEISFNLAESQRLEFYAENLLYKPIKVKIKGRAGVSIKTEEPLMQCPVEFTMLETHKSLFSTTTYKGLRFSKSETLLLLSGSNKRSVTLNLKDLKIKNGFYIIPKKKIRTFMR